MLKIKSARDLGAGLLFLAIGAGGFWFGRKLNLGTAARMGPGYFPMMLSGLICFIGLIVAGRSFVLSGLPIERPQWRPLTLVIASMIAFGLLIERAGLVIAVVALILMAALARREKFNFIEALGLAVGLSAFSVLAFVYGLGQSLRIWWGN